MATTTGQRVAIWIIAIALTAGTIGGFLAMMAAPANEAREKAQLDEAMALYQSREVERNKKVEAQANALSEKYYADFSEYTSKVEKFDKADVKELKKEDLKVGDGAEIDGNTKFAAYYVGWNPAGKVFDQSIKDGKLGPPITIADGLDKASLIEGWKEGMKGMKIGGVRMLSIPSDKAYGAQGQGEDIPANSPLKFIVMAIPEPEQIPPSEVPELVKKEYLKYGVQL